MIKYTLLLLAFFVTAVSSTYAAEGTRLNPTYHEAVVTKRGNDTSRLEFFSFKENGFAFAGANLVIKVLIDKPSNKVWPYFKDFNTWGNKAGYYYWDTSGKPGVHGDMKGKVVRLGPKEGGGLEYVVHTVIPNRLIGKKEVVRETDGVIFYGDHAFILTEKNGKTLITMVMQHANQASHKTEDELLKIWTAFIPRLNQKSNYFLDEFMTELKRAVKAGK